MKAFYYKDQLYIRLIPAKRLFNSTTIHEVVNRGDIFAMNVATQEFTVVPGKAEVVHCEVHAMPSAADMVRQADMLVEKPGRQALEKAKQDAAIRDAWRPGFNQSIARDGRAHSRYSINQCTNG